MTGDERVPWWYSGDPPEPEEVAAQADEVPTPPSGPVDAPGEDETPPGVHEPVDEPADSGPAASSAGGGSGRGGPDWLGLLSGAQRLVDWAADAVLTGHAGHDDPRAHPECLVCRAGLLLRDGDRPAQSTESASNAAADGDGPTRPVDADGSGIRWLTIRE